VNTLGRKVPKGCTGAEAADMEAVRAGLSYPDASGDTAIWMIMAVRPIAENEEILVEKYQDLISGHGHDSPEQGGGEGARRGSVRQPRQTKRSSHAHCADASLAWATLRPSLDALAAATATASSHSHSQPPPEAAATQSGSVATTANAGGPPERHLIPPQLVGAPPPFGSFVAAHRAHRPWGGVCAPEVYLMNQPAASEMAIVSHDNAATVAVAATLAAAPRPFRKDDGGVRLNRAEGVQALRRASVLGRGVYLSLSAMGAQAGTGLFAGQRTLRLTFSRAV
jgi:hypothetical protein